MITLKEETIKENFKKLSHNGELDGKIFVVDKNEGGSYIYHYEDFKDELLKRAEERQFELGEIYEEYMKEGYLDGMEEVIYEYLYDDIFKDEKIIYEYYPVKESLFEEYDNCYLVVRYLSGEVRNALEKVIFSDVEVNKNNINELLELNDCDFEFGVEGRNHKLLNVSKLSEADLIPFLGEERVSLEAEVGEGPTEIYLDKSEQTPNKPRTIII